MNDVAVYEIHQFIRHGFHQPLTAAQVIDHLRGLQASADCAKQILNRLLGGGVAGADLLVEKIENGSLLGDFIVKLTMSTDPAEADRKIEEFRAGVGLNKLNFFWLGRTVLVLGSLGVLYFAWKAATPALTAEKPATPAQTVVNNHFENSFNGVGKELGMTGKQIVELIESSVTNKDKFIKAGAELAHPGGIRSEGTLTLGAGAEGPPLEVPLPPAAVAAIPTKAELPAPAPVQEGIAQARLILRAMDLDRAKQGWFGIAPEITDARLPIELHPDIDGATLPLNSYLLADVVVEYKKDKHGNRKPKRLTLVKIHRREK